MKPLQHFTFDRRNDCDMFFSSWFNFRTITLKATQTVVILTTVGVVFHYSFSTILVSLLIF